MRVTLADPSLARNAGRFVWLDLNFDKPANKAFLVRHGVMFTPSFFVIDPADDRVVATNIAGMTLIELNAFLDRGEHAVKGSARSPADAALGRGDANLGRGHQAEAADAYRDALRVAAPGWTERDGAVRSLAYALMLSKQYRACADVAVAEAPRMMPRTRFFGSVVMIGLAAAGADARAPWAVAARRTLEPLAMEAVSLPETLRDDRFQLYQQLMHAVELRGEKAAHTPWGVRWLHEIETTKPANDDERTALDVARVDAASAIGQPARVIPALIASEQAMPNNYNASLRLAEMESDAKRYDEAVAACDRGLAHVTGPIGRTWLLQTKAEALTGKGDRTAARRVLDEALRAAREISTPQSRESNVKRVSRMIEETAKPAK